MEAFVEGTVPMPGNHGWHADGNNAVVLHTTADLDTLITTLGLGYACYVSSLTPDPWPRLAGPCCSQCAKMASPARLASYL